MLNDQTLHKLKTVEGQLVFFRFSDVEAWVTEMPAQYLNPTDGQTIEAVLHCGIIYSFGGATACWLREALDREAQSLLIADATPQTTTTESGEDNDDNESE